MSFIGARRALLTRRRSTGITSSDPDVRLWITRVIQQGGTVTQARANIMTTMVAGMKADGTWSVLDVLWIYAAENAIQASVSTGAALQVHALTSPPTFTANVGYTGDGAANYIDTGWHPNFGNSYTQNNVSNGVWVQTADTRTASFYGYGGRGGTPGARGFFKNSTNKMNWSANNSASTSTSVVSGNTGLFHIERTAAGAEAIYRNGNTTPEASDANASSAITAVNEYVLAGNNGSNVAVSFCNGTVSAYYLGGSMGTAGLASFYARLHTALNAINATAFP